MSIALTSLSTATIFSVSLQKLNANLKWVIDLNLKLKAVELLEDNMKEQSR